MMKKLFKGIRMEPLLVRRCEENAKDKQLNFSEWARQILRREVGLSKK